MSGTEMVALMTVVFGVAIVAMSIVRGPIGKAFAERLSGRPKAEPDTAREIDQLHSELEEMKHRLSEAEDRLDFAERLLAKQRQESLGPGK